jgi:hypothetical protein
MKAKMGLRDLPAKYQALIHEARPSKYHNQITEYNGFKYHSAKEAKHAQELDLLVRVGELKSWQRQVPFPLKVNSIVVAKYVMDFVTEDMQGNKTCEEVKGMWTDVAKLKRKLFEALYPGLNYKVI